jgi:uncharacterized repeat protein (TIGR03803 family)
MQIKRSLISSVTAFTLVLGILIIAAPGFAATREKVLHSFSSGGTDGITPHGGLIIDVTGNLYGVTYAGGDYNYGTVFQLTPGTKSTWTETVLYSFNYNNTDGVYPTSSLVFDAAGNLYGTTWAGGTDNTCSGGCGTVFELSPGTNGEWNETVLYSYQNNGTDGNRSLASVVLDKAGNLYGTTSQGGAYNAGTVFELTPGTNGTWRETVLYSFTNAADGAYPYAGLVFDKAGNLYGTTGGAGAGWGTVFELSRGANGTWTETVLDTFNGTDGATSFASLIFDKAGNLYGTTYQGGANNTCSGSYGCGTVFELTRSKSAWTEKVLHSFNNNGTDGFNPYANLIFDKAGNLYGTTSSGGAFNTCTGLYGCGAVFELVKGAKGNWTETVLHSFDYNGTDGFTPSEGGLVFDKAGNLYGVTYWGINAYLTDCSDSCGTAFEVTHK